MEIPDAKVPAFATEVSNCAGNPSCTFLLPVNTNRAFAQWDFPMTKEANTCVGKTL